MHTGYILRTWKKCQIIVCLLKGILIYSFEYKIYNDTYLNCIYLGKTIGVYHTPQS